MLSNICPHCGKDRGNAGNTCPHCEAKVEKHDTARPRSFAKIIIPFICLFGVWVIFEGMPNHFRARTSAYFTICMSNEKNIGTALEVYAVDHKDMYPAQLQDLVPNYLKSIPTCPEAHKDTYSSTYACSKTMKAFTFTCAGENHYKIIETDYPQYNSRQGLITGK